VNLLLLTPQPPLPAHQGSAIRNWGILRHLALKNSITLLSFASPEAGQPATELSAVCRSVELVPAPLRGPKARLGTLFVGQADLADRLWSPQLDQALRRILTDSRFDLVQVEGLELGRYLATIRACAPQTPILYDAHNAEVTIQQRAWQSDRRVPTRWPAAAYSWLQVRRLARFEARVCRQAAAVTCVSASDAAALRQVVPGLQPVVIANGIDLVDYPVAQPAAAADPALTFTGKMDYRPNVDAALWFAREILPLIRARIPAAHFEIVGQKPAPALAQLDGRAGVAVLGAVADVRPQIAHGAVYVAPLRMGGGTRFKLLEAMALGRPVVSTTIGAEGFDVRSGRELLLADTPADFAGAVLQLLADARLAGQLARSGRAFVEAHYDWSAIIPRLEALHTQLVSAARPSVT
jgi:sugar transferase (PEP-CTERM/EpsH1 system associated)